ncbi:MAG: hypothetical protein HQ539_03810 [Parcubacteria group bacterium]|nr:hypothetical protein [Parcubacteria group bacterium]
MEGEKQYIKVSIHTRTLAANLERIDIRKELKRGTYSTRPKKPISPFISKKIWEELTKSMRDRLIKIGINSGYRLGKKLENNEYNTVIGPFTKPQIRILDDAIEKFCPDLIP